jgi:hypothetical protein
VSSARPACERAVRVLVAEAADPPEGLSGVLEGAGHRVVARAVTVHELAHLVRVAQPEVVVFDAEISADAVAALRVSRPEVGVVVVWPDGATAASADEQVSPARIRQDLAGAVGRSAPVGPPAVRSASSAVAAGVRPADAAAPIGRGGLELSVAAVLTFLLVVAAVAFRVEAEGVTLAGSAVRVVSPPGSTQGPGAPATRPSRPSAAVTPGSDIGAPRISSGPPSDDPRPGSAGLLQALARLLQRDGAMPGRGPTTLGALLDDDLGPGSAALHRRDGSGHPATGHGPPATGHGPPAGGNGSDHRHTGSLPGHGSRSGHGHPGGHGPPHRPSGNR